VHYYLILTKIYIKTLPLLQFEINNFIQPLQLQNTDLQIDVLRLDKLHKTINGNKYFKLKYALQEAQQLQAKKIISYGGVWSNHIAALAAACKQLQLPCVGYIRSDEQLITATLQEAAANGMQIVYCTRAEYKAIKKIEGLQTNGNYHIPEGGATILGIKGASEILAIYNLQQYTHIVCAMGTGTTFSGLLQAILPQQKLIGINALKGGFMQRADIENYLTNNNWELINDFHFGGFAKYDATLITFMNSFYQQYTIPTDVVYTAKVFYAVQSLIEAAFFSEASKILIIHTGGLQGNKSLTKETLCF
jgi:1-aminocyclopropane-1-carboxylate deaminase